MFSVEADPAIWHREVCWVTGRVAVSGDLATGNPAEGRRQLAEWVASGVTHIVDVRDEWSDADFVAALAPEVSYHWQGTHDMGGSQDYDWFDAGVKAIRDGLYGPNSGKVLVHCHMGINRAPSLAFAYLLTEGYDPAVASQTIRTARPIAAMLYWDSALRWFADRAGWTAAQRGWAEADVAAWHAKNPLDVRAAIRRIREES